MSEPLTAQLIGHTKQLPLTGRVITYEWQGDRRWPVWVSDIVLETTRFEDLPWPLKKIERDPSRRAWLCVRTDVGPLPYLYHRLRAAIRDAISPVYYRLILTAHVWGLAYVPQWEAPSWRHLGRKRL